MTRSLPWIANRQQLAYASSVAANSAARFGDLKLKGGHRLQSGFFTSAAWQARNGRAVWETRERLPVPFEPVRQPARFRPPVWRRVADNSPLKEASAMTPRHTITLNPFSHRAQAARHRRMALAALRCDSSLSVRWTRYQSHMQKVRALEAVGGVK